MYEQPKSKKRIVRNCNDRRKGTDQPDVCTDDTVCSKKPENVCQGAKRGACKDAPHGASYESVFKSGRKGSGKLSKPSERDTSAGRASVKGRNISGPDGTCAGCDGEKTDVPQGNFVFRELIGMEEKVKETAEQIEELLKSMRELGV